MNHIIVYLLFIAVEYSLRTFFDEYKHHSASIFLELLPIFITTLIGTLLCKKEIVENMLGRTYTKLTLASIGGLTTAKAILFYQWYWISHPEYRDVEGDMGVGLALTLIFLTGASLAIMLFYIIEMITLKALLKKD